MLVVGLVGAVLAAAVHGYIFVLESMRWTLPRTRQVFGTTPEQAEATRPMAYNQGFYNLFLGILALLGVVVVLLGGSVVGPTLILAGTGCMLGAALVLLLSSPALARAAVLQGAAPAVAVVFTALHLVL